VVISMEKRKYYAFISYCHRDARKAKRLYRRMQRFRVPPKLIKDQRRERKVELPRRLTPIFIDDEEMMGTSVKQGMQRGLSQSRFLVVVCSPNSAKSTYVDYEADYFVRDGREDHIIPYIIEGRPCSNDPDSECYPPTIRKKDKLGADEQQLKEDALLRVIATMLNVDMGVLSQKEKQRKIRRILCLGAAVILFLAALLVYTRMMNQRIVDQHQLMLASESKRLTTSAVNEDIDMDLSILLARQACDYLPEAQVETSDSLTALRSALAQKTISETRDFLIPIHTLTFDSTDIEIGRSFAGGKMLACRAGERTCLYDLVSGERVFKYDSRHVFFSPDASWCVVTELDGDKCVATGLDVPSGEVLFQTDQRDVPGKWSGLVDVVVFEDGGATAYIVSGVGPDKAPVDAVTVDGVVTRYGFGVIPDKVRQVYAALSPDVTWYDMALTSACYTEPYAVRPEDDPLRDDLAARGYTVEGAQLYPAQDLRLYQCRSEQEARSETLLFDREGRPCGIIPGSACYDAENGCIYAKHNETVRIYHTQPDNRRFKESQTPIRLTGISRDGSRGLFLYQAGDTAEGFTASHEISQQVQVCSLEDGRVLFDGALHVHVSQIETILCQIDVDMNGLLYLDPAGEFHLHDISAGRDRCAWPAESIDAVSAMCFSEDAGLIAIALIPEDGMADESQDRYQIELRDIDTGALLSTCDITQPLDVGYQGTEITTVRLLNGKLLVGTTTKSCLFDVSGNAVDVSSCLSFDSMQGNCADPLSALLTDDGLLFFTSVDLKDDSEQCLRAIYDIGRGAPVEDIPPRVARFAYDAGTGTLACQAYASDDTLSPGVRIYRRQADGSFLNTGEILSGRPDMALRGGRNALDGDCIMLENDACCEIYRLEDGMRMLWLSDTGFALRNGRLYDMQPGRSLGTTCDYQLDYAHARALSERMLETGAGARDFTRAEMERYYIVSMEERP